MSEVQRSWAERWAARGYMLFGLLALVEVVTVGVVRKSYLFSFPTLSLGLFAVPIAIGVANSQRFWRRMGVAYSGAVVLVMAALLYVYFAYGGADALYFFTLVPGWVPRALITPYLATMVAISTVQIVALGLKPAARGPLSRQRARNAWLLGAVLIPASLWCLTPALLIALLAQSVPVTYSGRVIDETGAPIEGAKLLLIVDAPAGNYHIQEDWPETDAEGRYRFADLPTPGPRGVGLGTGYGHEIYASAEGYATAILPVVPMSADMRWRVRVFTFIANNWPLPRDRRYELPDYNITTTGTEISELDIVLPREATIHGRVVDAQGRPVPDYAARIKPVEPEERTPFVPRYEHRGLRSKFAGIFRVDGVPPGTYTFERWIDELNRYETAENPPLTVAAGQAVEDYTLIVPNFQVLPDEFGALRGRVERNGQPSQHGYVKFDEVEVSKTSGNTGKDGIYEVRFVPPGEQVVRFTMWLYEDQRGGAQLIERRLVDIVAGKTTTLDVAVDGHGRIYGDFAGPPDTPWLVQVEDDTMPGTNKLRASTWKFQHNGAYELPDLPPGSYHVYGRCMRDDDIVAEEMKEVVLEEGGTVRVDFDLRGEAGE